MFLLNGEKTHGNVGLWREKITWTYRVVTRLAHGTELLSHESGSVSSMLLLKIHFTRSERKVETEFCQVVNVLKWSFFHQELTCPMFI